ncbi:penicillin acylase family protein [Virgibacillus profundi]|uniref:Penicillin acylase family protein n=1 Tax=Virgibacillus profundi TaxID=2024555 RepID=A0A2A2IIF6_9BACI|nr:penicillin acylase family protein [Virgibacillus profundi]PAV30920.1 penicillin acylase family protein [Virgibacillus profundi]PXY55105.1 penicillin acylase family protein [Virgibacillus profundi]
MDTSAYKLDVPQKKKRNKKKIVLIVLGIIIIIGVILFIFANVYINRTLPQVEGEIELPMLEQEVTVITDENGVPHIQAANEHDLYIAQGYIQAQDRIFQMEMSRRQASGTLSEIVGESAVDHDKYFRSLGLRRAAEKSYDIYTDESKEVLQWFADGVNQYINEAKENNTLPIEFTLMGAVPAEWTPLDSLTIGKYMAFDLGGHWERQAFNYYVMNNFEEEKAYELFPSYPEEKPTIIGDNEIDIASSFEKAVIPHAFNGSNNWVVSGEKTASGMPLLADDPHLGLATPSIWLQMHLETEDINVSGVIFAGVPGIILGHNENIAWGVTNTGPDVQQLYMEKRNPENPHEFLFEDVWEEADVIDEPIKVKDSETIDYQVVETRHGPIISEFAEDSGKDTVLSLRWTALDPTTELEAILDINKAQNWEEFEAGLEKFLAPAQNFVFASTDGTIAYKANGNIPIYENGDDALLPLPGWEADHEWNGFIPFDELPRVVNPDKGFIATANNKIAGDDYPYHISNVWAQPYRYERIAEVLESSNDLTAETMMDLQMDVGNLQAREFVPIFSDVLGGVELTEIETEAMELLNDWDFMDEAGYAQPLIFHNWMDEMEALLYNDEIPENVRGLFGSRAQTTDELLRKAASGDGSIWIEENGGIEEVLHSALKNTLTDLEEEHGEAMSEWQWGDYHKVQFHHPLSGIHPVLAFFFNNEKSMSVGGSSVTPMAASYDASDGEVDHGASWRFVIDMNDTSRGHHIVGPGQSGHFKSDWYHDQMDDWVEGNYHETKLDGVEGKRLELVP